MDLYDAAQRLDLSDSTVAWLRRTEQPPDPTPIQLPSDDEAERLLCELDVGPDDRADTLAARPDPLPIRPCGGCWNASTST